MQKVAGSNPVTPTIFQKKPFGENVEGLSHCGDESCVIESAVQKHDFEDSTLCSVIGGKPLPFTVFFFRTKTGDVKMQGM